MLRDPSQPALQAVGLCKRYGRLSAVEDLHLALSGSRVCGFLGPNGAGKTTTIRMLLGLSRPTSGTAAVFGHDIERDRAAVVPLVGAMLETPSFYPHLGVLANLRVCALSSGLDLPDVRLRALVARVGLAGREMSPARTLSLGMKQRLGLAAALLSDPGLLLLDEPANGLDPRGIAELRGLLAGLASEGRTILLSSHVLAEVEQTCDEVVVLNKGRVVMQGSVADLLNGGKVVVIVSDPALGRALVAERLSLSAEIQPDGALEIAAPPDRTADVVDVLVGGGVRVHRAAPRGARLETLYLELTAASAADERDHGTPVAR